MNNHIISKEKFDSLFDDNIKKKEYDIIIKQIGDRVDEILETLAKHKHIKKHWYCYRNGSTEVDNEGGCFDPETDYPTISFQGDIHIKEYITSYDNDIPTCWLWESNYLEECNKAKKDWEENLLKEKEAEKNKIEANKKSKDIAIQSIRSKLTKEELNYINFK